MIRVGLLADHAEALGLLAAALEAEWGDWYGPGRASARDDLVARTRRSGLPLGLVACDAGTVLGTCALTETSGSLATDRGPWLGGLLVLPAHRRRGVGAALVRGAAAEARQHGHRHLFTLTRDAAALFDALGWQRLETVDLDGTPYRIHACDLP